MCIKASTLLHRCTLYETTRKACLAAAILCRVDGVELCASALADNAVQPSHWPVMCTGVYCLIHNDYTQRMGCERPKVGWFWKKTRLVGLRFPRDATCSCLSLVRLDTGPKRSIERLLGGKKINFLIRGAKVVSRAGGMLSIRGPQVSLGSLRVGTRRAQSPTPYTRVLPAPHTDNQVLGQTSGSSQNLSMIGSTQLSGEL
jgi:hypothetical protein